MLFISRIAIYTVERQKWTRKIDKRKSSLMDRRRFQTIGEIESYINSSSSDDEDEEVPISAKRMKFDKPNSKKITSAIYIPPADVDAVSDEELIDDDEMITEVPAMTDVCGELEVDNESDVEDIGSPPACLVGAKPSRPAKTTKYTAEKDFGTPNWKISKRVDLKFGPPDESAVESLKNNIVESLNLLVEKHLLNCFYSSSTKK